MKKNSRSLRFTNLFDTLFVLLCEERGKGGGWNTLNRVDEIAFWIVAQPRGTFTVSTGPCT